MSGDSSTRRDRSSLHASTQEEEAMRLEIRQRDALVRSQATRIAELEEAVRSLERDKHSVMSRSLSALRDHDEAAFEKDRLLNLQQSRLTTQEATLQQFKQEYAALRERTEKVEASEARWKAELESAKDALERAATELRRRKAGREREEQLALELQHSKMDNARLLQLLCSTREYEEFGRFVEDSGGVSYIVPSLDDGDSRRTEWEEVDALRRIYNLAHDRPVDASREAAHWLPSKALKLSSEFRARHLPHVSMETLAEFLKQLNSIWSGRERRRVDRLKSRFAEERARLQRMISQRTPYEDVVAHSRITTLQRALRKEKAESKRLKNRLVRGFERAVGSKVVRPRGKRGKKGRKALSMEERLLETSLVTVETLSREMADYAKRSREMEEQLSRSQSQATMSATRRVVTMLDAGVDSIDRLMHDYHTRFLSVPQDAADYNQRVLQLQVQFISRVKEALLQLRGSVRGLFESSARSLAGHPAGKGGRAAGATASPSSPARSAWGTGSTVLPTARRFDEHEREEAEYDDDDDDDDDDDAGMAVHDLHVGSKSWMGAWESR